MPDSVKDTYRAYMREVKLMQLATCRDGQPWLCSVWYVADGDDNLYFISRETRRHSQEIADNEKVCCTIVKDFTGGLGEKGRSLTIAGTAKKLSLAESAKPFALYAKRYPKLFSFQSLDEFVNGTGHHFFYKVTPSEIVWWDEQEASGNPRQQVA